MSLEEAEMCAVAISSHMESARLLLLEMDRRNGWKALGYKSLADYFNNRMQISTQEGYRRLGLYAVEENLNAQLAPVEPIALKGRWLQDSQIHLLEPVQQVEAYELAKKIQAAEHASKLVGRHMVQAVKQIKARNEVFQSPYPVIAEMVASGSVTAAVGQQLVEAVAKLPPRQQGPVLELVGEFGLQNAEIVAPLGALFGRPADKQSLILPEVMTGHLGGVPLAKATLSDWRQAAEEARQQHMADNVATTAAVVQPLVITIYKGDVIRTVKALKEVLGDEVYNIRDMLMKE